MANGVPPADACLVALILPITDDADLRAALGQAVAACLR
jgi:nitric oxide reductase NorQ protein